MFSRTLMFLSLAPTLVFAESMEIPTQPSAEGEKFMVSATNQYVTKAGYDVLKSGGNAVDAMVAMQMVMTVVEPDMTGLGGGSFALYYDKEQQTFTAYDGRDKAPMSATPDMFIGDNGKAISRNQILGPRSVAIPGTLKLLYTTHQKHGSLPWKSLVEPAIEYARQGYAMNSYTYDILVREQARLADDPEIKGLYWQGDEIKPAGSLMTNPSLAKTLEGIALQGDAYMYQGDLAKHIVQTVNERLGDNPHKLSVEDFASYRVIERQAVESDYHKHKVVSFGYPASGGVMVSQALSMLEGHDLSQYAKTDAEPWRLMVEAMRLAKEDRIAYAGDPSFIADPTLQLLDDSYVKARAELIPEQGINQELSPGAISEQQPSVDESFESQDTGHISIVDGDGNAISMTSTVGTGMGSGVMVDGLLLNAQMANFSYTPIRDGKSVSNAIDAGKRPRSAITPTMVMDPDGKLRLVVGSPGSAQIPGYVLKTIVGVVDWELSAQDAIDLPNIQYGVKIDRTKPYNPKGLLVEKRTYGELMVPEFVKMGYPVQVIPVISGLNAIELKDGKVIGATDRRRASTSMGE